MWSSNKKNGLLLETDDTLQVSCEDQNFLSEKNVTRLIKSDSIGLAGRNQQSCLKEISEPEFSSEDLV